MRFSSFFTFCLGAAFALQVQAQSKSVVEVFCEIRPNGTSLNCSYSANRANRVALSDKDISVFLDRAQTLAYMSVRSLAGYDRTFQIDPAFSSFKKLIDLKQSGSVSEISRAKSELFAEIEKKVIQLSNELDGEASKPSLVRADPAICSMKSRTVFNALVTELDELKSTCQIADGATGKTQRVCYSPAEARALAEDNKTLTQYMTSLLEAFNTPESCLGDNRVKVEKDGTVDLGQVPALARGFRERCKLQNTTGLTGRTGRASATLAKDDYFNMMLQRNKGKPEVDPATTTCENVYSKGPFVITGESFTNTPLCYGIAKCTTNGKEEMVHVSCEAGAVGDIVYCAKPTDCLKSNRSHVWQKNVRVIGQTN